MVAVHDRHVEVKENEVKWSSPLVDDCGHCFLAIRDSLKLDFEVFDFLEKQFHHEKVVRVVVCHKDMNFSRGVVKFLNHVQIMCGQSCVHGMWSNLLYKVLALLIRLALWFWLKHSGSILRLFFLVKKLEMAF